jgi:hypothetical protein
MWLCPLLQLLKNFTDFDEAWYMHYARGGRMFSLPTVNNNSITEVRTSEVGAPYLEIMCGTRGKICNFGYSNMFIKYELQHSGRENIFLLALGLKAITKVWEI